MARTNKLHRDVEPISPEEAELIRASRRVARDPDDPVARAAAIAHLETMFRATGNPLWFWRAYQCYRDVGATLPGWILIELDDISQRLLHVGHVTGYHRDGRVGYTVRWPKNWKAALLAAFGFKVNDQGGKQSPFPLWEKSLSDQWLATCVRVKMADGPHNETDAVYLVASIDHGLPEIKVRRAWKKYQAAALSGDLNRQRKQVHSFAEWVKHKPTAGDAVTNY